MIKRLFGRKEEKKHARLAVAESENTFGLGRRWDGSERDRQEYDREKVLEDALDAWRFNPLARRIVGLTSQYVLGSGLEPACKEEGTARFITLFWNERLNRMNTRLVEMCDELTRSGNLFVLVSTDAAGMSYVRLVPAADVERIEHQANDIEQATRFYPKATMENPDPAPWKAYDRERDERQENGSFEPVMLHYTVNKPAGAQWGESDLAPVLKWLQRFSAWLEDRARLNRYRNSFLFVVKSRFGSETERAARQASLAATPPTPGSIMVCDESENWEVLSPRLESSDANTDGLALKKMIAAGVGVPLHFLAEPESSTRTTAEAAGGPTFRYFEQRQEFFTWLVGDLLRVVIERRAQVDRRVRAGAAVEVVASDISARDNVSLSMAGMNTLGVVEGLRDRGMIDDREALRLVYRALGETVDLEEMLARGKAAGRNPLLPEQPKAPTEPKAPAEPKGVVTKRGKRGKVDPETGELTPAGEGDVSQ